MLGLQQGIFLIVLRCAIERSANVFFSLTNRGDQITGILNAKEISNRTKHQVQQEKIVGLRSNPL